MGQAQEAAPGAVPVPERRKHPRYMCALPVEIRQPGVSFPSQGQTTDISVGGCYISSRFNMAVGTTVDLKVWVGDVGIKTQAVVRTFDPGVGNGMAFVGMTEADQKLLGDYLSKLDSEPKANEEKSIKDLLIF